MQTTLKEVPDGFVLLQRHDGKARYAACLDGGRFHGWLMQKHPDGQWVSQRKLESWEIMQAEDQRDDNIIHETAGTVSATSSTSDPMLANFTCEARVNSDCGVISTLYFTKIGAHGTYQLYRNEVEALYLNIGAALELTSDASSTSASAPAAADEVRDAVEKLFDAVEKGAAPFKVEAALDQLEKDDVQIGLDPGYLRDIFAAYHLIEFPIGADGSKAGA